MSDNGAPSAVLQQLLLGERFVDGNARLTPWAAQALVRALAYLGSPIDGGNGQTVAQQLSEIDALQSGAGSSVGGDALAFSGLAKLEAGLLSLPPDRPERPHYPPPLPPLPGASAAASSLVLSDGTTTLTGVTTIDLGTGGTLTGAGSTGTITFAGGGGSGTLANPSVFGSITLSTGTAAPSSTPPVGSRYFRSNATADEYKYVASLPGGASIVQSHVEVAASAQTTITLPAAPVPGNILIYLASSYLGRGPGTGWTSVAQGANTIESNFVVFSRVAVTGDGTTYTPKNSTDFACPQAILEIAVYGAIDIDFASNGSGTITSGGSLVTGSASGGSTNATEFAICLAGNTTRVTAPAPLPVLDGSWSLLATAPDSASLGFSGALYTKSLGGAGDTLNSTVTLTGGGSGYGGIAALAFTHSAGGPGWVLV